GLAGAGLLGQTAGPVGGPAAGQGTGRGAGPVTGGVGGSGLGQIPGGRGGPPVSPKKRVLIFAGATSFHHGSISDAIGHMYQVLNDSGLFEVEIKTDTKWISKQP